MHRHQKNYFKIFNNILLRSCYILIYGSDIMSSINIERHLCPDKMYPYMGYINLPPSRPSQLYFLRSLEIS